MSQLQEAATTTSRTQSVEAYLKALRTGEASATRRASPALAADVVLRTGAEEISGHDAVLARITGQWPLTPVLAQGAWSTPREDGERVVVSGEFNGLGAAPARVDVAFSFNLAGQIHRIEQTLTPQAAHPPVDGLPAFVKALVNGALANGTPMCVAYTDESGQPVLSLRGSTQAYSDTQLSIWVRNADGGLVKAMSGSNPKVSLLYRDSKTRTTLIFQGRGRIEASDAVRARVYALAPEVEQNHDPSRRGAALVIDITQLQGTTVRGPIRFSRAAD
ncbi:MAG TPA: nuclear transport factor 2 family protein [Chloroflexota bacterium]|jgi:hypothetical protein|nr:nuclear transport factor 2 family protein [Chloroflexota bacterium]